MEEPRAKRGARGEMRGGGSRLVVLLDRRDDSVKALAQISGICRGSGSTSRLLTGCFIIVRSDLEGRTARGG